jgi:hypothetical protein
MLARAFALAATAAVLASSLARGGVVLPHSKGGAVTLNDGLGGGASSSRCEPGDYVCELIEMHTSGLLTNHKLTNLTTQLDSTWQKSMMLGVNLNMLSERVQTEIEGTIELRADVRVHRRPCFPRVALPASV